MSAATRTPLQTFDAFGEPIADGRASDRTGSARLVGAVVFWAVAGLLVAGRFFVTVPQFDPASAPVAATSVAQTVAQVPGPSLR